MVLNKKDNCYFLLTMDCERVQDKDFYPAGPLSWSESEANIISFAETAAKFGYKVTFFAVPEAAEQHADIFRELISCGHEVGLHLHPNTFRFGINEHLGNLPYSIQYEIIRDAANAVENAVGFPPKSFRPGYFSANQDTFRVLEALKFKRGSSAVPGRQLLRSGSDWKAWPRYCQYVNSYFEAPVTVHWVNKSLLFLSYAKNILRLTIGGFIFAATKSIASLASSNSPFKTGQKHYLLDFRIENCDYNILRRIIAEELKRMRSEENFPVLTSLTHSYVNFTDRNFGKHEYGMSRKKLLIRLLNHLKNRQDVTIMSRTLSGLQNEYDRIVL